MEEKTSNNTTVETMKKKKKKIAPPVPPKFENNEKITTALGYIVGQLDLITQTMNRLEERMSANEKRVLDMQKHFQSA